MLSVITDNIKLDHPGYVEFASLLDCKGISTSFPLYYQPILWKQVTKYKGWGNWAVPAGGEIIYINYLGGENFTIEAPVQLFGIP